MTEANGDADPGARPRWRWDVALSFAGAQRDYVGQVAEALKARGVRCFYDADEEIELWGKYLAEELLTIYGEQVAVVVVFVSAEYAARDWTRHERRAALARAVRERREYVLPARFDDTPLPGLSSDVVTVNLRSRTPEQFAAMIAGKLVALGITEPTLPSDAAIRGADNRERREKDGASREETLKGPSRVSVAQVGAVLVTIAAIAGGLTVVGSVVTRLVILFSGIVLALALLAVRKLRPRLIVAAICTLAVSLTVAFSGAPRTVSGTSASSGGSGKPASAKAFGRSVSPGVEFQQIFNSPVMYYVRPQFVQSAVSSHSEYICDDGQHWISPSLASSKAVMAHLEWIVVTFHVTSDIVLEMGYIDAKVTRRISALSWAEISCGGGGANDITVSINLTQNQPMIRYNGLRHLQVTFKKGDVGSIGFYAFVKYGVVEWKATWHYFVDGRPGQLNLATYPLAAIPLDRTLPDVYQP